MTERSQEQPIDKDAVEREVRLEYERRILALEVSLEAAMRVVEPAEKLAAVMRRNTDNLDCALTVAKHRAGWEKQDFTVEPWMPLVESVEAARVNWPVIESDDEWRCKLDMVRHNTPGNPQPASSLAFRKPTEQTDDAVVERVREAIVEAALTGGGSYRRDIRMVAGPPERMADAAIAAMPTGQTNRLDQPAVHPYAAVCYRRDGDGWKQVSVTQSEHDLEAAMDIGIAKLESRQ